MPAAVKDSAIQRTTGCEEQGVGKVVWEVLVVVCVDSGANKSQHCRR